MDCLFVARSGRNPSLRDGRRRRGSVGYGGLGPNVNKGSSGRIAQDHYLASRKMYDRRWSRTIRVFQVGNMKFIGG